jgi:hypothetical protein
MILDAFFASAPWVLKSATPSASANPTFRFITLISGF